MISAKHKIIRRGKVTKKTKYALCVSEKSRIQNKIKEKPLFLPPKTAKMGRALAIVRKPRCPSGRNSCKARRHSRNAQVIYQKQPYCNV